MKAIKEEQKRLKKEILSVGKKKIEEQLADEKLSAFEEQRAKYLAKKRQGRPKESQILAKLDMFTKSLFSSTVPEEGGKGEIREERELEEGEYVEDSEAILEELKDGSWKNHVLKFKPVKKVKDPNRMEEGDRYTTFDPLLRSKVKPLSQHRRRLAGEKKIEKW